MKKILILGSNGFIGRNLREYLDRFSQYELLCPNHFDLNLLEEMQVKDYLLTNKPDVVINAAVCRNPKVFQSTVNNSELEQDLRMFFNLEKYHDYYGCMLNFGSGAEYDKRFNISSVKEDDFINCIPVNDYGFAKYLIGKEINHSKNIYNLRIFGLFGKYENWKTTFISGACCKALKGLPITIRQNVYFDYLYINDFCPIIRWFIDNTPKFHTYNISSGCKRDLFSIAQIVRKISGNDVPIYVCKNGIGNEYTSSNERLLSEMNSAHFTQIEDAINDLMQYYRSIIDTVDVLSLLYQ